MSKIYRTNTDGSDLLGRDLTPHEVDQNFRDSDSRETTALTLAAAAVNKVLTASSDGAMTALTANKGDICKRTDGSDPKKIYQLNDIDATLLGNWILVGFWSLPSTLEDTSNKNAVNGYCGLDGSGKVAAAQLPSYVDDVLEFANLAAFPGTGESGKIYVALDTNAQYRWSGSAYIELVASPGTTDAVPEGSTNKYFTAARVLATILTGIGFSDASVVTATDTILQAIGKLQEQITDLTSSKLDVATTSGWQKYKLVQDSGVCLSGAPLDFNSITNSGVYDIPNVNGMTNKPAEITSDVAGILTDFETSSMKVQDLMTAPGQRYRRAYDNLTSHSWSSWA